MCCFNGHRKPKFFVQIPLHNPRVSCWSALWSHGISMSPFFLRGWTRRDGDDQHVWTAMSKCWKESFACDPGVRCRQIVVPQEASSVHISRNVQALVQQNFEEREIGRYTATFTDQHAVQIPMDFLCRGMCKGAGVPTASQQPEWAEVTEHCTRYLSNLLHTSLLCFKEARLQNCINVMHMQWSACTSNIKLLLCPFSCSAFLELCILLNKSNLLSKTYNFSDYLLKRGQKIITWSWLWMELIKIFIIK